MAGSVVMVTGCSSGIGADAARRLARSGATVIATARDVTSLAELEAAGIETRGLDVVDDKQRRDTVAAVLAEHGRIDALVNNAGYGVMTAIEDTSLESLRAMFEVNVYGAHALTCEVLPAMRRQRSGRIVNVSSIAGHLGIPLMGAYCGTKAALVAMTQALHNEVRPFGIHACLIEPGRIRTSFGARSRRELHEALPDPEASPYAGMYRRWLRMRGSGRGADPGVIGRAIVHACLDARPRFHYFAPLHAKAINVVDRLMPDAAVHLAYRAWFRHRP